MKTVGRTILLSVAILSAVARSMPTDSARKPDAVNIADILEPIRKEYNLPALAAAVVSKGKVIALGAVGERKYNSGITVTTNDRFHLGSCTKAMTATMIGMLVEQGKLRWGMKTAGFGAMGTPGKIDEPWQHTRGLLGPTEAIAPGRYSDNPPVIAPGGTMHCSMRDWAKFIILHLEKGSFAGRQLIKPDTLGQLRKPYFGGNYAGGWGALDRSWGGGRVFSHSGSNNQNYAVVWMAPLKRYAVLVATNQGGGNEAKALDKVTATLIGRFKP